MEEEGEYAFPEGYSFGEGVAESPRFELEYRGSGGVGSVTGSHIGNTHTEEKRKKKNGKEGRKTHGSVREKKQRHKRPLSRITKEISKQEIQSANHKKSGKETSFPEFEEKDQKRRFRQISKILSSQLKLYEEFSRSEETLNQQIEGLKSEISEEKVLNSINDLLKEKHRVDMMTQAFAGRLAEVKDRISSLSKKKNFGEEDNAELEVVLFSMESCYRSKRTPSTYFSIRESRGRDRDRSLTATLQCDDDFRALNNLEKSLEITDLTPCSGSAISFENLSTSPRPPQATFLTPRVPASTSFSYEFSPPQSPLPPSVSATNFSELPSQKEESQHTFGRSFSSVSINLLNSRQQLLGLREKKEKEGGEKEERSFEEKDTRVEVEERQPVNSSPKERNRLKIESSPQREEKNRLKLDSSPQREEKNRRRVDSSPQTRLRVDSRATHSPILKGKSKAPQSPQDTNKTIKWKKESDESPREEKEGPRERIRKRNVNRYSLPLGSDALLAKQGGGGKEDDRSATSRPLLRNNSDLFSQHKVVPAEKKKPSKIRAAGRIFIQNTLSFEGLNVNTSSPTSEPRHNNIASSENPSPRIVPLSPRGGEVGVKDGEEREEFDYSSCSLETLLEFFVSHYGENGSTKRQARKAFFDTYTRFTTPEKITTGLMDLFCPTIPQKEMSTKCLRIIVFLKIWWEECLEDVFSEKTSVLLEGLLEKIEEIQPSVTKNLKSIYAAKKNRSLLPPSLYSTPQSDKPFNLEWNSFDTQDLALCITLTASKRFFSLKKQELLEWNSKEKELKCPSIYKVTDFSNAISDWVRSELVRRAKRSDRVKLLSKFMNLAELLLDMNNFSSCMAVISGINSSAIYRMKKTWAEANEEDVDRFKKIKGIMSHRSNYAGYRAYLKAIVPPGVPFIGHWLTDLTFIEDGNSSFTEDGKLNFSKFIMFSGVIENIQFFQSVEYSAISENEASFEKAIFEYEPLTEDQAHHYSKLVESNNSEDATDLLQLYENAQKELAIAREEIKLLKGE